MEDEMLMEVLKEMQKKYQCFTEIERITKDIGEALSRNDRALVQILLGMRQEEIEQAEMSERNIHLLLSFIPTDEATQALNWIKGNQEYIPENPIIKKLVEKGNSIRMLVQRTIELDRHISMRLAGKDSFYQTLR
jgi:REP element-mobilizing transposase RayT